MEDVGTSKVCRQNWEVNVGLKIKQTTSIYLYISTYTAIKQNTKSCTYVKHHGSCLLTEYSCSYHLRKINTN